MVEVLKKLDEINDFYMGVLEGVESPFEVEVSLRFLGYGLCIMDISYEYWDNGFHSGVTNFVECESNMDEWINEAYKDDESFKKLSGLEDVILYRLEEFKLKEKTLLSEKKLAKRMRKVHEYNDKEDLKGFDVLKYKNITLKK